MLKQESGGHSDCRIAVIPIAVILQSPSQGKWPSVSLPLPGVKKTIDIIQLTLMPKKNDIAHSELTQSLLYLHK
jgi:hypothetical protein